MVRHERHNDDFATGANLDGTRVKNSTETSQSLSLAAFSAPGGSCYEAKRTGAVVGGALGLAVEVAGVLLVPELAIPIIIANHSLGAAGGIAVGGLLGGLKDGAAGAVSGGILGGFVLGGAEIAGSKIGEDLASIGCDRRDQGNNAGKLSDHYPS